MCIISGIVNIQTRGKAGNELVQEVSKLMLKESSIGNTDGAGIALSYQDERRVYTLKSGNSGQALAEILDLNTDKDFRHVLLHTRFSTGSVANDINAHPHSGSTGNIMHNGWCPFLYDSIRENWHHNTESLKATLQLQNGKPDFISECDSEALALIFDIDPAKFAKNLIGDEVFALAHIDHDGDNVTLFTQHNTVYMAYSHALAAVIFATREHVVQSALEYLGEQWPIARVDNDKVYYFDGRDMTGGDFDFDAAVERNVDRGRQPYKQRFLTSEKSVSVENATWIKKEFVDGSVVWELPGGELVEKEVVNLADKNEADDAAWRQVLAMINEKDEDNGHDNGELGGNYLQEDFEAAQKVIHNNIKATAKAAAATVLAISNKRAPKGVDKS